MSTWQEKNAALLASLAETPNPSVRGNAMGCYLRDACKDHQLTLYEQCAYEELLLQDRFFQAKDKKIRGEIEELLVELYLLQE